MSLNGAAVTQEEIKRVSFWTRLAETEAGITISFYHPNRGREYFIFERADLEKIVGISLAPDDVRAQSESRRLELMSEARADRALLVRADMSTLMHEPRFAVIDGEESSSMQDLAAKHLSSKLAIDLIRTGYIDRDFTLYSSLYYSDRVSYNATNYILKCVDPNVVDAYFKLSEDDVAALLRERPAMLNEDSSYNIDLVDAILGSSDQAVDAIISRLVQPGDAESEFLTAYLTDGEHADLMVTELAERWSHVVVYLTQELEVEETRRIELINVALSHVAARRAYTVTAEVTSFFEENLSVLIPFADSGSVPSSKAIEVLLSSGAIVPDLTVLNGSTRESVVAASQYEATRENLLLAADSDTVLPSLDALLVYHKGVYDFVLSHLGLYLDALTEGEVSLASSESTAEILQSVWDSDAGAFPLVLDRVAADALVAELAELPPETWPLLAERSLIKLTVSNADAYIKEHGLDVHLELLLANNRQLESDVSEDGAAERVALTVLKANAGHLRDSTLRVELLSSIGLEEEVIALDIPSEEGHLVGDMVSANLALSTAEVFARIPEGDFEGRIYAMTRFSGLVEFMTTEEVSATIIADVLESPNTPSEVKASLLENLEEYVANASLGDLIRVAQFVQAQGNRVPWSILVTIARSRGSRDVMLEGVLSWLPALNAEHLAAVLGPYGGELVNISRRSGKRPLVDDTPTMRAIIDRLIAIGIASKVDEENGMLRVSMRKPRE